MYTDFYGLIREPFGTTPDADNLFLSPSHREALGSILYGIKERKGIILVTGEVGVGKTTILRRYLQIADPPHQHAPNQQKTIHLYNPNVTFERLLITILHQLRAEPIGGEEAGMLGQLHEVAKTEHSSGGRVVLVIDEAQCMPVETLEGIRMLSNLETANEKLIQIVLMGQPEMEALLERHEVRHVRERIAVRARILPLTKGESFAYIQHRLDQASREQVSIFSTAALRVIVKASRGTPRRLNILCANALMTGFRQRQPMISRKIAKHVVAEIDEIHAPPFWRRREAIMLAAILVLSLPLWFYLGSPLDVPWGGSSLASRAGNPPHQGSGTPVPTSSTVGNGGPIVPASSVNAVPPGMMGASEYFAMRTSMNSEMVTSEEAESGETARLLVVLLDSGRVVLGRAQATINNPRLEDKGFSSAVFQARLRKEFLARTGHDLQTLGSAAMPEGAKPMLAKLAGLMQKAVQDVQENINKKGIGFKGFIPATFGTQVAASFSKETGLKLRQIGPPKIDPRNPDNKPDEEEASALLTIQKSHPRVGDHVIAQQLPDKSVRVLLPLFYTKACLACHGRPKREVDISGYEKEGFKEGDLGGAISVTLLPGLTRPVG